MNSPHTAIIKAIDLVGLTELARLVDASPSQVSNWRTRGAPTDKCIAIERATNGQVTCEELNPKMDWAYLREGHQPSDSHTRRTTDEKAH